MSTLFPLIPGPAAAAAAVANGAESSLLLKQQGKEQQQDIQEASSAVVVTTPAEDEHVNKGKDESTKKKKKRKTKASLSSSSSASDDSTGEDGSSSSNKRSPQYSILKPETVTPTRACLHSPFDSDPGELSAASASAANKKTTTTKKKAAPRKKKAVPNKKKAAPNKKGKSKTKAIPFDQRRGRNFDAATTDCLSEAISKTKAWKELKAYCLKHPHLDCPILSATMSKSLTKVLVIICKHFPGNNHFDEMTKDGLLWLTKNGYFGELCLRFLTSTINNMIVDTDDIEGDCRDNIAFMDINMCPAPNNCGGDHNHLALQVLTTDVLVEVLT